MLRLIMRSLVQRRGGGTDYTLADGTLTINAGQYDWYDYHRVDL